MGLALGSWIFVLVSMQVPLTWPILPLFHGGFFGCLGCLVRSLPLGRPVLPSKNWCFLDIKILIFDDQVAYNYINISKTTTPLDERPPPPLFALGALRGLGLSGGPFYLVKIGVSFSSRFRS